MKNRKIVMHRSDQSASVGIQMSRISPRFKRKIFTTLAVLTLMGHIQAQTVPSPTQCTQSGYYYDTATKQCQVCPAGFACSSTSSKVPCTTGTYSLSGQIACSSCPTGFVCPTVDQAPKVCLQGTYPSADQLSCTDCPLGKICINPENKTPANTCTVPQFYQPSTNQVECTPCPAGKICSTVTGAPTSCATGYSSTFGTGQCSTSTAGKFVPAQTMAVDTCPTGLYQNQAGQSTCKYCDAGSSCSSTSASPSACPTGQFSAEGSTTCSTCASGYLCSDKTQASQTPCVYGQYLDTTATPNVCKTCPNGYQCSENAILTQAQITAQGTTCPVGYTQTGKNCLHVGYRNTVSMATSGLTTITACAAGQYVPYPGAPCTTCPANTVCNLTPCAPGSTQDPELCTPCPSGLANCTQATIQLPTPRLCPAGYYASSNSKCTICPEGSYCPLNSQPVACGVYTYSGKGMTQCLQCPAGYDCATQKRSTITKCAMGYFSKFGQSNCTKCLAGQSCPYNDAPFDECVPGTFMASDSQTSSCTVCPEGSACATKALTASTTCKTTEYSFIGSTACVTCPKQGQCVIDRMNVSQDCWLGQYYDTATKKCVDCPDGFQCSLSAKTVCPKGTQYDKNFAKCVECTDVHICVYDQTSGANSSPNRWCYGKDPAMSSIMDLFVNANRLPASHYQWCIDCNHPDIVNSVCTFSTNYFVSQTGANITCPTKRSAIQEVTIAGIKYKDQRFWDPYTQYKYPWCKADLDMYWPEFSGQILNNDPECLPIVEYLDKRYIKACQQTYPGFSSVAANQYQSPTDLPLSTLYSIIEQRDFGTKTILKQCPEGQEFITKGAGSQEQGCFFKKAGDCKDAKANFCHDGTDFKCLRGFTENTDGTVTKRTKNKCTQPCLSGSICSPDTSPTVKPCNSGRYCFDGTEDSDMVVSRPGRNVVSTTSSGVITYSDLDCTQGKCPPGQAGDLNYCPPGFRLDVSKNAHGQFNCHPNEATKFTQTTMNGAGNAPTVVSTPCTDGYYCPEAVRSADAMIPCEPGTYSNYNSAATGAGPQSKTQCQVCPAGMICSQGSKTSTRTANKGGFYSVNNTRHIQEYYCPSGTFSSEGNSAKSQSECTACPAGSYCKDGTATPVMCPNNAYCPQGSSIFTDCPMNYLNVNTGGSSISDCQTCPTNNMCPGGSVSIACPAGTAGSWNPYNSVNDTGSMLCKPVKAGSYSATAASNSQTCPDGKYSSQYAKACVDCPEGYYCTGGVRYACTAGQYCPSGSSSNQACPAGKISNQARQDRQLFCPSGSYCTSNSGSATTVTSTNVNYFNVQGETTYTQNQCGNGYLCMGGSTGPYDFACPANTLSLLGETQCKKCTQGKWCPTGSGLELDCPLGFYCNGNDPYPTKCPKGTYGAAKNLQDASYCTQCPPGKTCSQNGLIAPDGDCDAGYYCKGGSWTPQPEDNDPLQAATGGLCLIGGYCPKGSGSTTSCNPGYYNSFPGMRTADDCIPCTAGYYCAGSANPFPTAKCSAGSYCTGGSATPTQFDATPGHYALEGSTMQIQCEAGTYSDTSKAATCKQCDSGKYCPDIGMTAGIPCPAGYYCPLGSINEAPCLIGTYNPNVASAGANACLDCDPGKYCDQEGLTAVRGDCQAGFYCNRASPNQYPYVTFTALSPPSLWNVVTYPYGICPRGYYCPLSTSVPTACPLGYYLNTEGADSVDDCIKCNPGYYCNSLGLISPVGQCDAGFYCPETSQSKQQVSCPTGSYCPVGSATPINCAAGYYQDSANSISCKSCTAGNYCEVGSSAQAICPPGYYCPALSELPTPCPTSIAGYYNPLTGQTSIAACILVPKNLYALVAGSNTIDGIGFGNILDGFNNTAGSRYPIPPAGTFKSSYCPRGYTCIAGQATACPAGQYCEDYKLTAPSGNCLKGYYCTLGSISATPSIASQGGRCPQSQYCVDGSTAGTKCPTGTYSNGLGLFDLIDCNTCPDGYVCDSLGTADATIKKCPAGYYCPPGIAQLSTAIICPIGSFCPLLSSQPQVCPPGKYQDQTGQSSCKTCLIGSYCSNAAAIGQVPGDGYIVDTIGMVAPAPCPPKTYKIQGQNTVCTDCPAGFFCDEYGLQGTPSLPDTKKCPGGFYCPAKTDDYSIYMCQPGYYCPVGSSTPTKCDVGKYCDEYQLSTPKGNCEAGYFCILAATKPNPDDGGVTGQQCDKGYYCLTGATTQAPCPIGKYNDKQGASSSAFCLNCPSNKVCNTLGLGDPVTQCDEGYYCTTTNGVITKTLCDAGYRCPANEQSKYRCLPGTYQDQTGQKACKICAAGYFCYESDGSAISQPKECPKGYYCPDLSSQFTQNPNIVAVYAPLPCPVGTYSDATKLNSITQCKACPAGYRCNRKGQETYDFGALDDNKCINGYVCSSGTQNAQALAECPLHFYCIAGVATSCPPGTYGSTIGLASASECVQCAPGLMCLSPTNQVDCPAGFYCTGGISMNITITGCPAGQVCPTACPVGNYCPSKSLTPVPCAMGFFQDETGKSQCKECPAGTYCQFNSTVTPTTCIDGMFCVKTSIYPKACSIGTKPDAQKATCIACPQGKYCWPEINGGLVTSERGICAPGYICNSGSYTPKPFSDTSGITSTSAKFNTYNGPVLRGYTSSDGKTNYPCPAGSYQPSLFGSVCLPCQAGSYCEREATGQLREDSFPCPEGVICAPSTSNVNTAPSCPQGLYSERGSPHCMRCSDGYYKDASQTSCKTCPFGMYCNNTLSLQPQSCTDQTQCTGGDPYDPPCDSGTYLSSNTKQCVQCTAGKYCVGGIISGDCTAGFLCNSGSSSPSPDNLCPQNNYCLHGAGIATPCKSGTFRSIKGGIQSTDCSTCEAGQICPRNQVPQDCPKGFYCPVEAGKALACPAGTYGDKVKLIVISDCKDCPAGYLCSQTNTTNFKDYPCPLGSYCISRALAPTSCPAGTYRNITGGRYEQDCYDCPAGYYCPQKTIQPIKCVGATNCPEKSKYFKTCEGGYYCNDENNQQQTFCPMNYYCPRGTQKPIQCSTRYICQEGSELPLLCQAGNIVKQAQYGMVNTCEMCPQGTYSTVQDEFCNPCTPGYLCYGQTSKKFPTLFKQHKGEICPKGFYCPLSSYLASPCPIGTYNPEVGASSITQCLLCPSDTFNDRTGQSGCRPCGAYASSTEGSFICKCVGNFRTFSVADSSCRCMSGYDFIDSISGQSRGKESGTDNCSPLVFDRCDGLNQTRSASGKCVSVDDCSKACNGGNGTRSLTLGTCTCFNKPNVDLVCGQSCRNSAPKLSIANGTTMNFVTTDPKTGKQTTTKLDLSKVGDLYGSLTCATGENCDVKTTEMSASGGFYGKYGAPSLINSTVQKLRMLHSSDEDFQMNGQQRILSLSDDDRYYFQEESSRKLAVMADPVDIAQAALKNPVICLAKGDSMIFTIRNPNHYPIYLKDSVINSNPSFDYGSLLILADQMKAKQANNITSPSMFAFTFTVQGTYVFVDAADQEQLMIVRVAGAGESCPDPDRYIQPLSSDSLSSSGVKQKEDIIIKPDVPLLVGMGSILVLSVLTVMIGVGYCLHKGWSLPKVNLRGYRSLYLKTDVDHVSEETFRKNNDFAKFKSFLDMRNEDSDKSNEENLVGDEDDLDDLNLNIHLDVLSAGQEYLKVFGDQKVLRAKEKRERKSDVLSMITEIEHLINTIGSDALIHQMQLLNEEEDHDGDEDGDGDGHGRKKKNVKEQQDEQRRKQQEEQQKAEDDRRQKMMQQEWSERDRQLLEQAKTDANDTLSKIKKELNRNVIESISGGNNDNHDNDTFQVGLYDQNAKSRQNQIVRQIESDPNLSEAEKESLLRAHNQNLTNIDEMMDAEKRKQDSELEKAIRDRAERRRKALENKYKKEINAELKEGELLIKEDIEARKVEGSKAIDSEIDHRLQEAGTTGDKGSYRRSVDDLKKERTQRKSQLEDTLNKEQDSRILTLREQVMDKWTKEAMNTDADLEAILTGQQPSLDDALSQLRSQKESEEAKLRERLEQRRRRLKEDLNGEKDKFEEDLASKDPIVEEELEKKKQIAMMQHQSNIDNQGSKTNLNNGGAPSPLSIQQQSADSAQQNFLKVLNQVDSNLSHSALIDALREQGADEDLIERLRQEQEEEQRKRLDNRRELLRQRKALKKQQELENKKLEEQLNIMQDEDDEKSKIGKQYLKEMFVQAENIRNSKVNLVGGTDDAADKARQQERLVVFNEYASDELLKRLSNLLMKQFVEREAALKLLVQKYMDARLIEKTHIKANYKEENARLNSLSQQNLLTPEQLREAQCQLRLREENLLREVDIQFEKAHKEEEIRLRSDMDARHANEQVELRRKEIEDQARIRKELELAQGNQAQRDEEIDRINLQAFEEAKKREQERKQRSLHLHKQEVMRQLEGELRNKYTDYEELLRRKREEEAVLADQNLSIRKRLAERRQKIKENASMFSAEELKSMMEKHELYLQTFDSEYENERRRQQMQMMKRMQQRKLKAEKQNAMKAKADVQDIDKIKARLGNGELKDDMDVRMLKIDEREDSELVRRLREWTRSRQELKVTMEQRQLAETVIDLDAMTLKKLISKLDNLEKGLRELRKMELIKAKMPNRPSQGNNDGINNQGGNNYSGLKNSNGRNNGSPLMGLIQSPQEIHYKEQMPKFVQSPGVHQAVANPFSKVAPQKQSPTVAKDGNGAKGNIMSPTNNVDHKQVLSPRDKLKPVEEETRHGMKKEDYTKFSKFAKKR